MTTKRPKSKEFISDSDSDNIDSSKVNNHIEERNEDLENIPYASISKAPKKFSSLFKVTIFPKVYENNLEREHFYETLFSKYEQIELIVSKEDYQVRTSLRAKSVIKIFLDFSGTSIKGMFTPALYKIINEIFLASVGKEMILSDQDIANITDTERRPEIMIEKVKCKKLAIVWATHEFSPRFTSNFDPTSEFSESNRIYNWAKTNQNEKFSIEMPFVQSSRWSHTRLKDYLIEFKNKNRKLHVLKKVSIGPFDDWRDLVINWWNNWIESGWFHKRQQLFLLSKPNCGKTTFIRDVLFRNGQKDEIPTEAILIPERSGCRSNISNFAWQKSNPYYNVVVFCDEFDTRCYNIDLLKIILQGDYFTVPKKNVASADDICLRIPMIFASNHKILENHHNLGLRERFLVIEIPDSYEAFQSGFAACKPYNGYFSLESDIVKKPEILQEKHDINSCNPIL